MLVRRAILERIAAGTVTLAFRRWKRPTICAGGRLRTAIGVLAIDSVYRVSEADIGETHAQRAGFASRADLLKDVSGGGEGDLYRISLRLEGEDPPKHCVRKAASPSPNEPG